MVAVKAHEADRALARLDPGCRVVLFYGPDQGLVRERAAALARGAVSDAADPFLLVRIDGSTLADDPLRLADEANTIGLFGGQRAIWISGTSRSLVPALEPVLANPPLDALIVIEGGDLAKAHALRTLAERSKAALAVPCYADEARGLDALIDMVLREHGLGIDREARSVLQSRLGADRQLSRRELEKLALFAHGQTIISRADVEMIVGDAAARDIDDIIDGVFTGSMVRLEKAFTRLTSEGAEPATLLGFVIRHATALSAARTMMTEERKPAADAASTMRGLPFPRKSDAIASLQRWDERQLLRAIGVLQMAAAQARRHPTLSRELAQRALWNLAVMPQRS